MELKPNCFGLFVCVSVCLSDVIDIDWADLVEIWHSHRNSGPNDCITFSESMSYNRPLQWQYNRHTKCPQRSNKLNKCLTLDGVIDTPAFKYYLQFVTAHRKHDFSESYIVS